MGIDATFVGLMKRFGANGKGAAFGYPDYLEDRKKKPSEPVFHELGVSIDIYDIGKRRGDEILIDLNQPVRGDWIGKYDFIVNPGTIEQCFNAPNALKVMYQMTRPKGLCFHHGNIARPKNGYWSQTFETMKAFCSVNGTLLHQEFREQTYYAVVRRGESPEVEWPQQNNVR